MARAIWGPGQAGAEAQCRGLGTRIKWLLLMGDEGRIEELEAEVRALRAQLAAHERHAAGNTAAFLSALLEAVPAFILRADAGLRIRYVNRVQPGLSRDEVIGTSLLDFVEPAHREMLRQCTEQVLASGNGDTFMLDGVGPNGSTVPYDGFIEPIDLAGGDRGICMVVFDISATRLRESALRESDEKLRLALDATGIALWSWSPRTGVVEWDARMHEIMGRDTPLALPAYLEQAVHPDDRERAAASGVSALQAGPWEARIHRIVRPDASTRWVIVRGFTVASEGGDIERLFGCTVDVTDQRRREEQARHVQRLDALGQITAGVAHNFNNLLTVINSNLELLTRRTSGIDAEQVDEARQATLRAAELIRHLMTFAGQRPHYERRSCAVGPVVERAVEMCRRTFPRHVALSCSVEDGLAPVLCSEGEIEQIVMNLLLNARDAVLAAERTSPRIAIRVDGKQPCDRRIAARAVRIEVSDDGVGMTDTVRARVFDPFFTTKPPGQGAGLGLSTSYAIARELGGELRCSSTAGAGATFELYLPGTEQPSAEISDAPLVPRGRGRVLLIDDEGAIRRVLVALLEDAGFSAEAEASGEAGVARLATGPRVDVVLLDRSMPAGPGETFIARIREVAPSSKIILFSGQLVEPALAAKVDGVVLKPASATELVAAITALVPPA